MIATLSVLFVIELVALFFLSRISITRLFQLLRRLFQHDSVVFSLIACIFFPGTVIHELSHFVMAIILFLRVREIHVFPEWEDSYIKLGKVYYEKKDVFRSILVGLAPIFVGILLFWWMYSIQVLSIENIPLRILMIYFIFILSTSMFSSKQDLVDIVYIIPFLLVVSGIVYVFDINIFSFLSDAKVIEVITNFLYSVNTYIGISIGIHTVTIIVISGALLLLKRK